MYSRKNRQVQLTKLVSFHNYPLASKSIKKNYLCELSTKTQSKLIALKKVYKIFHTLLQCRAVGRSENLGRQEAIGWVYTAPMEEIG